jgi:hypothetical protein
MSANKKVSVCVATSPRPLIEVDADRTGQKAAGQLNQAATASYVRHRSHGGLRAVEESPGSVRKKRM